MWEYVSTCGLFGLAILALTPILFLACVLASVLSRTRVSITTLLVLSLIPLLLGVAGTFIGYSAVARATEGRNVRREEVEAGREIARRTTYLGVGATAALLVFGGLVMFGKKGVSREDDPDV